MLGSYLESEGRLSKENINQRVAMISGYYFPNLKILIFNNFLIILFCKKKRNFKLFDCLLKFSTIH